MDSLTINSGNGSENPVVSHARVDRPDGSFLGIDKYADGTELYTEGSTCPVR